MLQILLKIFENKDNDKWQLTNLLWQQFFQLEFNFVLKSEVKKNCFEKVFSFKIII